MRDVTSTFNSEFSNNVNTKKVHKLDLEKTKSQKSSFTIKSYVDLEKNSPNGSQ